MFEKFTGFGKEDFINIRIPRFFGFTKPKKKDVLKDLISNPSDFVYVIEVTSDNEIDIKIKKKES